MRSHSICRGRAHLFEAVDYKAMSFHDGPDLCSECAEQLSRVLFESSITNWEGCDKVDVWIRIGLFFVKSDVNHGDERNQENRVRCPRGGVQVVERGQAAADPGGKDSSLM